MSKYYLSILIKIKIIKNYKFMGACSTVKKSNSNKPYIASSDSNTNENNKNQSNGESK